MTGSRSCYAASRRPGPSSSSAADYLLQLALARTDFVVTCWETCCSWLVRPASAELGSHLYRPLPTHRPAKAHEAARVDSGRPDPVSAAGTIENWPFRASFWVVISGDGCSDFFASCDDILILNQAILISEK